MTTKIVSMTVKKVHKRRMSDKRPSIQAKVSRPEDVLLVKAFKAKLAKMKVEEAGVVLALARAYMECVKRDKGALPQPPFVLHTGPRD